MNYRNFFELLYFITAGPILVVIASIGLWQLKIARDTARMNAKRESYKLAADQCSHFLCYIIPLIDKLNQRLEDNDIKYFEKAQVLVENNSIRIEFDGDEDEENEKLDIVDSELLVVLNSLEAFALFFVSGVADEQVAFSSVGQGFCDTVKYYMPEIFYLEAQNDYFANIVQLFLMWNERIEQMRLMIEKRDVEEKLKRINGKTIRPLGTE